MKQFLLGMFSFYMLLLLVNFTWVHTIDLDNKTAINSGAYRVHSILNGDAIIHTVTGRCVGAKSQQWFGCNGFMIYVSDILFKD